MDVETLEWLEEFILRCGRPVVYISHDETLLENTANVILHIEQLRRKTLPRWTVARMGYRQYVEERLGKMQKQTQLARKEREEDRKRQEKIQRMEQQVQHRMDTISHAERDAVARLLKKKMKSVKSMEHRFDRERGDMTEFPDSEEAILVGFDGKLSLPMGKPVLDMSLPVLKAADGEKLAEGIELQTLKAPASLDIEFLTNSSGEKAKLTQAKTYLGSMKYTPEECGHSIEALSGGQKAKLFILKMVLDGNDVLILDEPTRNFSPLSGPVIRGMLAGYGGCVISVSHDRKYIEEVGETRYELREDGLRKLVREG